MNKVKGNIPKNKIENIKNELPHLSLNGIFSSSPVIVFSLECQY